MKLSICIPYRQRLQNIRIAFEALARQTMDPAEFEIIVGCMEYSEEYVSACREFIDRISIVTVMSSRDFDIPKARNLAMRQATGEVVVQMDADTLLPPDALRNLYDRHFRFRQNICVVGQVVGYGNNNDGDVHSVRELPYEQHAAALKAMAKAPGCPGDPRFQAEHVVPWAFGWTGLIALPTATVRTHGLYFDESFSGWGVDDLEWSYRVAATGTPITLCPDVYALHLPHVRDSAANRSTEKGNYRRFLAKWPTPDVELAHALGDVEANARYLDYRRELDTIAGPGVLGSVRGRICGGDAVVVGVRLDRGGRVLDPAVLDLFDQSTDLEYRPLAGLALPFDDRSLDECRITPLIQGFSSRFRDAVLEEAGRIAKQVTVMEGA